MALWTQYVNDDGTFDEYEIEELESIAQDIEVLKRNMVPWAETAHERFAQVMDRRARRRYREQNPHLGR